MCDEFFHPEVGGWGGFGWLAREIATLFAEPGLYADVVFLAALNAPDGGAASSYHGVTTIFRSGRKRDVLSMILRERVDLLFSVDYRVSYRFAFRALPRTPAVLWVQDPRPPADVEKVKSLRIPGQDGTEIVPSDIMPSDCDMEPVCRFSSRWHRTITPAISAPSLADKASPTYCVPMSPPFAYLPYPVDIPQADLVRAPRPKVVFLGRLDPIKRPWLFAEVARAVPEADFVFLGAAREKGPGTWDPAGFPENLRLAGHLDGGAKVAELASAWVLVNTSIHEALPVSFIEALCYELPVVSCQDPESVASRFGRYVGRWDGTGLDSVALFASAVRELINNHNERVELGRAGREWARSHHGRQHFLSGLADIGESLGFDPARFEGWR